jgi:hypothetical protein
MLLACAHPWKGVAGFLRCLGPRDIKGLQEIRDAFPCWGVPLLSNVPGSVQHFFLGGDLLVGFTRAPPARGTNFTHGRRTVKDFLKKKFRGAW